VLSTFLHAGLRVQQASGVPHALFGRKINAKLGRIAPRECEGVCTTVIARLDRAIQYSETLMMESKGRGVLDTPPSRSMTVLAVEI
jgi:hypothetical protein